MPEPDQEKKCEITVTLDFIVAKPFDGFHNHVPEILRPSLGKQIEQLRKKILVAPKSWESGEKRYIYRKFDYADERAVTCGTVIAYEWLESQICSILSKEIDLKLSTVEVSDIEISCVKGLFTAVYMTASAAGGAAAVIGLAQDWQVDASCEGAVTMSSEVANSLRENLRTNKEKLFDSKDSQCVMLRQQALLLAGFPLKKDGIRGDRTAEAERAAMQKFEAKDLRALYSMIADEIDAPEQEARFSISFKIEI